MPKDEKVVADAVAPAADLSPVGDSVRISSEVVAAIASMASVDIPGIAGMSGGVVGGLAEKLGRRDLTKGIRVTVDEDRVRVDLNVIVEYGMSIVESTDKLKKEIRSSIEKLTGLKVEAISINVQGISMPKEPETGKPEGDE